MKTPVEAVIHDWHQPRNNACAQNHDVARDCECVKPKKIKNRKPYRVCRVHDREVPHGAKADIILEVHPNGRLILREKGRPRRFSYATTIGKIYTRLLMNEALAKAAAKAKERRERKAARKPKSRRLHLKPSGNRPPKNSRK